MKKKNRFKKILSARKRKLDIINYRVEKLSRIEIEKERKKATDARSHYLQLESNLESTYKTMFESIKQLEVKARNRSNRITKNTVNKCRELLESARNIYINAQLIQNDTKADAEKIIEVKKDIEKKFIEIAKPYGAIGDNTIKTERALKQIDSMVANLNNISKPVKVEGKIL